MQTKTHQSLSRVLGAVLATLITVAGWVVPIAARAETAEPGPIPTIRVGSVAAHTVNLSWDAPLTDGGSPVIDYLIEYASEGKSWTIADDGVSSVRLASVTGLETGVDYTFRVSATNAHGTGVATSYTGFTGFRGWSIYPCGVDAGLTWTCSVHSDSFRPSIDYTVSPVTRQTAVAFDLVDARGHCYLSRSVGVICDAGDNLEGQAGRGYLGGPAGMYLVPDLPDEIVSISPLNEKSMCALSAAGDLWCWGRWGDYPSDRHLLSPTVTLSDVVEQKGQCAIRDDLSLVCVRRVGQQYQWVPIVGAPLMQKLDESACGVSIDRRVLCVTPSSGAWGYLEGITNAVDVVYSRDSNCALVADGTVTCVGQNHFGQFGDGTNLGGRGTTRLPEKVTAITSVSHKSGYKWERALCALGASGRAYCWGGYGGVWAPNGFVSDYMPGQVLGIAPRTVQPLAAPAQVTGLRQTGRATRSVAMSWNPVASPQSPLTGYRVDWREGTGDWSSREVSASTTTWTSPILDPNSTIDVRVAALNGAGAGTTSTVFAASTTSPPARPTDVRELARTESTVTVKWSASADEDEPITGYRVEWTTDQDTWHMTTVGREVTQRTFGPLAPASAIDVRVRAINASGMSAASNTLTLFTAGTNSRSIEVTDSYGQATYGGQVTWRTTNGTFQSALDYGLTSEGTVTFPVMVAGQMLVTLRDVQLVSGALVNVVTTINVGYERGTRIVLPAEPSRPTHTVRVLLPNGLPVVGATVSATGLIGTASRNGATFTTPAVVSSGVTNEFGEVYLVGYSGETSTLSIEYNDGILIQRKSVSLGPNDREVTLEAMPWVESPAVITDAKIGTLVPIVVSAHASAKATSAREVAGATVTIVPPKGASQRCSGRLLTATFDDSGRALLKVCATKSGRYVLKGSGVVGTGAIDLRVRGATSLPVSNARAVSPSHGVLTVNWDAPIYSGGNLVTKYVVTVATKKKSFSKTVNGLTASFTGLSGATRYSVTVVPVTSVGNGEPVTLLAPVS